MNVTVQPREMKTYEAQPYVEVEDGRWKVRIDLTGVSISEYSSAMASYPSYRRDRVERVPFDLVAKAVKHWEKIA